MYNLSLMSGLMIQRCLLNMNITKKELETLIEIFINNDELTFNQSSIVGNIIRKAGEETPKLRDAKAYEEYTRIQSERWID